MDDKTQPIFLSDMTVDTSRLPADSVPPVNPIPVPTPPIAPATSSIEPSQPIFFSNLQIDISGVAPGTPGMPASDAVVLNVAGELVPAPPPPAQDTPPSLGQQPPPEAAQPAPVSATDGRTQPMPAACSESNTPFNFSSTIKFAASGKATITRRSTEVGDQRTPEPWLTYSWAGGGEQDAKIPLKASRQCGPALVEVFAKADTVDEKDFDIEELALPEGGKYQKGVATENFENRLGQYCAILVSGAPRVVFTQIIVGEEVRIWDAAGVPKAKLRLKAPMIDAKPPTDPRATEYARYYKICSEKRKDTGESVEMACIMLDNPNGALERSDTQGFMVADRNRGEIGFPDGTTGLSHTRFGRAWVFNVMTHFLTAIWCEGRIGVKGPVRDTGLLAFVRWGLKIKIKIGMTMKDTSLTYSRVGGARPHIGHDGRTPGHRPPPSCV